MERVETCWIWPCSTMRQVPSSSPVQPSRWPHYGKNTESVGELWLGLLRFYTEEFDFREHVVCIRQHDRLTTFNKQWTSKYIVIEGKRHCRHHCGSSLYCNAAWLVSWYCGVSSLISDPFDLNHNLGAGLSRKSKIVWCFYICISLLLVPIVCVISHHDSDQLYHEGLHQRQNGVWHSTDDLSARVPDPDG